MPAHRVPNSICLRQGADLEGFRRSLRGLIALGVPPDMVFWSAATADLWGDGAPMEGPPIFLPRAAAELVRLVVCHRDPQRYALLYQMVWRLLHGDRALLEAHADPLMHRLFLMAKAVQRDLHKMHAFVRFRAVEGAAERYAAWFEPEHFIVETTADFFVERFPAFAWSIYTPVGSLHWDRVSVTVGPPGRRQDAPSEDAFEAGWQGYYESTFNPARVNPALMRKEMPLKYWKNLPEAAGIGAMIQTAPDRVTQMIAAEAAPSRKRDPVKAVAAMSDQEPASLEALNRIIAASPPLVPGATQAVLGEGPIGADIAFVGEQPGDQEDIAGHPFVGPAGQILDKALEDAGIERRASYLTNAVKHFKFEQRGKRRLHQSPTAGEVKHYRWWLERELDFVRPKLVVALGATAVLALAGKPLPIIRNRGRHDFGEREGWITVHPSYLLRLPDADRAAAYDAFVSDLRQAKALAKAA
jgi:probable DNA metabolism protein